MSKNGELIACAGAGAALRCVEQRLVAIPCRGPKGCAGEGAPSCDMSVGQDGEACIPPDYPSTPGESACSVDKTHTLICTGKGLEQRFEAARPCRGPKACVDQHGTPACDQVVAQVGDRCHTAQSVFGVCSTDKKLVLECQREEGSPLGTYGGKFVSKRDCPTAKGCEMLPVRDGDSLMPYCDFGTPKPGTPCGKGNGYLDVCEEGKTSILKCESSSQTFQVSRRCPKGETCQSYNGQRDILTCAPPPAK